MSGVPRAGGGAGTREVRAVARSVDVMRGQLAAVQAAVSGAMLDEAAVQTIVDTAIATAPPTEIVTESSLTQEQGTYVWDGTTFYATWGSDGGWVAHEYTPTASGSTGLQSGTQPVTVTDFTSKTYDADV